MLNKIFHSVVIAAVIVHIIICSDFFGGTKLWSYLTLLCEVFFVVIFIQYIVKREALNCLEKYSMLYFLVLFILTVFNGLETANLIALIGRSIEIATLLMIVKLHRTDLTFYLLTVMIVLSVAVYINYYLLILNPTGMLSTSGDVYYFLGTNYNQIGPKVMFAFLFSIVLSSKYKIALLNAVAVAIVGLQSLLIVKSMTSTVCFVLLLFVFINSWNTNIKKLMLYSLLWFFILFQIFVVFFGSSFNSTEADSFLAFIKKDRTFTGRTILWEYSANYFFDSPIWGHGFIDSTDYYNSGYFHGISKTSHNYIYNILHKGGVLLLLIIYKLIKISYQRIKRYLNHRSAYTILITLLILLVMSLFEIYDSIYLYFLLIFMFYYQDFIELSNKKRIYENSIRGYSHL